jgi:ABC-type multidrug transport system fused ATPase/permease subunit
VAGLENAKKKRRNNDLWRACRYLWPHRKIVVISMICAVVVGIAFTGGLGTILPVMQILVVNGETLPGWADRKIVENRLDVRLADDSSEVKISRIPDNSPLARLDLKPGQILHPLTDPISADAGKRLLHILSDPQINSASVGVDGGRTIDLSLPPMPGYLVFGRNMADKIPHEGPLAGVKAIGIVLALLLALAVFGNVVRFFQEYLSEKAAILAVRDIRMHLYDHSLHLRLGFYGQNGTSDITSRLTQDAQGLQDGIKSILGSSVQESLKAAMALTLALYTSWELTLFIIFFGPVMFVLIKKFGKKIRRAARAALQNSSAMLGQIEGSLYGIRVVKASNAERFERRRFRGIVGQLVHQHLHIARLEAFNTPVLELLTLVVVCGIVLGASYLVLEAKVLKPGEFFLVMACLMGIGESLRKVSKINTIIQKSNAAAARLFEMIDLPGERGRQPIGARSADNRAIVCERPRKVLAPIAREVRFEKLTFTYPGSANPAIRGVDLLVPKGQSVAVVGRNGSGKTTLLALLLRFYDPQEGCIRIDGTDISQATLPSLRRQIGIVTQDSVIFPGTIADNIAYATPLAKRDDIIAAAKRAFAHEFILEKPSGYDTVLGEHGAQLSGGQKQRLCIARAILRQSPILILDEATSQVDAESEHLIQQAIENLMHERTTFVIAHRFSTIKSADTIVVMDRGQIVGMGGHAELLDGCPTYQQLYERQLPPTAA